MLRPETSASTPAPPSPVFAVPLMESRSRGEFRMTSRPIEEKLFLVAGDLGVGDVAVSDDVVLPSQDVREGVEVGQAAAGRRSRRCRARR